MKNTEIVEKIKNLLHLSKTDVKDIEVKESEVVEASATEEVVEQAEEPKVELADEPVEEVKEVEEKVVTAVYATSDELSAVKNELLSMIKALIEDNTPKEQKEVPQELSKEIELAEEVIEEIIHSPENVEKKSGGINLSNKAMTPLERVYARMNN
jgi:hypothetical protein